MVLARPGFRGKCLVEMGVNEAFRGSWCWDRVEVLPRKVPGWCYSQNKMLLAPLPAGGGTHVITCRTTPPLSWVDHYLGSTSTPPCSPPACLSSTHGHFLWKLGLANNKSECLSPML